MLPSNFFIMDLALERERHSRFWKKLLMAVSITRKMVEITVIEQLITRSEIALLKKGTL